MLMPSLCPSPCHHSYIPPSICQSQPTTVSRRRCPMNSPFHPSRHCHSLSWQQGHPVSQACCFYSLIFLVQQTPNITRAFDHLQQHVYDFQCAATVKVRGGNNSNRWIPIGAEHDRADYFTTTFGKIMKMKFRSCHSRRNFKLGSSA